MEYHLSQILNGSLCLGGLTEALARIPSYYFINSSFSPGTVNRGQASRPTKLQKRSECCVSFYYQRKAVVCN